MGVLNAARQQIAMQQVPQRRLNKLKSQPAPSHTCEQRFFKTSILGLAVSVLALMVVPATLGGRNAYAQTDASQATKPAHQQEAAGSGPRSGAPPHAGPASTQGVPAPEVPEAITAPPPAAPTANSPANEAPNQARVSWDSHGLEIEASNSSLNQILNQVAADTGAKLEGLTQDQRIFGSYGPGPGRDVLLKLLDGSGYNVLMIGGSDTDALREIVLSARLPARPQPTTNKQNQNNNSEHEEVVKPFEPQPPANYSSEQPRPEPVQNPFANGDPSRDPVQVMQEILQRQQKIDQQQQDQR